MAGQMCPPSVENSVGCHALQYPSDGRDDHFDSSVFLCPVCHGQTNRLILSEVCFERQPLSFPWPAIDLFLAGVKYVAKMPLLIFSSASGDNEVFPGGQTNSGLLDGSSRLAFSMVSYGTHGVFLEEDPAFASN